MNSKSIIFFLVFLLFVSGGFVVYFYTKTYTLQASPQGREQQEEVAKLVGLVGNLILLPQGETPTVATVTDLEKLKDQPFFANAKAGYKVLIYATAKKAILYDPENNKIVEVAPVNFDAQPGEQGAPLQSGTTPAEKSPSDENASSS